ISPRPLHGGYIQRLLHRSMLTGPIRFRQLESRWSEPGGTRSIKYPNEPKNFNETSGLHQPLHQRRSETLRVDSHPQAASSEANVRVTPLESGFCALLGPSNTAVFFLL